MADCERIRPLLFPYIEREAAPAEAMLVADHLTGCTACKILIARKRRLARMLDRGLVDRIPVGEEFVRSVMATLPEGPPPSNRKARNKRHLRIAGTVGVFLGLASAATGGLPGASPSLGLGWPSLGSHAAGAAYGSVLELASASLAAVAAWLGGVPFDLSVAVPSHGPVAGMAALALGALAVASGALAFAAGSILGSRRV
jgi:predicted anti-sigma-YlaC factor YlaD